KWSSGPAGTELFESLFVFENYPVEEVLAGSMAGVDVRGITALEQPNYPLGLMAVPRGRLTLRLHYDRDRLEDAAAGRLLDQLGAVLQALAAGPERRVGEVSLLRDAERMQLLEESRAPAPARAPACLHELLRGQAARTPGAVALACGGEALTYAELEDASSRRGRLLRRRGVGPEVRVGLCLEPGLDLVVGALGVLKAGGAYVPLDPAYPSERLVYVLADSGAAVLVTQSTLREKLAAFAGEVVCPEQEREAPAGEPEQAPPAGVGARSAAYLVYTSGSTGRPKGVVVEHGSLANTLLGTSNAFGLAAGEVFLALASSAFDIWGFEVFAPLLAGGQVHLVERETVRDVERLVRELAGVQAMHAVPALMREVVEQVRTGPGTLPGLRRVFVGGDAVPPDLLAEMREVFPAAEVRVLYGPTEATILSSAGLLQREARCDWRVMGRALPGVGLYVCDADGNLLPGGLPGELWVGGAGVARGYHERPGLTAERFVPDPLSGEAGARLYRTGDRVRRRADGELEFLGRTDQQVKIRGFRVEPGEVEAVLLEQAGVREAVVVAREDRPRQKRLVGYVLPEAGAALAAAELRARLVERLPEHMVPSAFVVLERLPLSANGKIDRRALPDPEPAPADAGHVGPRTEVEEVLCALWAEVLRLERVGVHDGFFELGGDSILSIQVVARAHQRGLRLTPRQLFEHPTVARLAGVVERVDPQAGAAPQRPVVGEAPLTPIQRWFFAQNLPAPHHFNQALLLEPRQVL
ncbi:MAG TPA: amino acid adenylation domain-containing protein, partial [Longimicrobiaceae bacterium]|nr:amino acid adenylation domain-containing protein [Longimicrobiaceae bacterium]